MDKMAFRRIFYYLIGVKVVLALTVVLMTGCSDGHDGQKRDGSAIDVKQALACATSSDN